MAEPLTSIVQAIKDRAYIVRKHYWEQFVNEPPRPLPSAIVASIGNDEPEIIKNYPDDTRGASCLVLGVNGHGRQIHTVIGYACDPIRIVTAYYPDDRFVDGRIRR